MAVLAALLGDPVARLALLTRVVAVVGAPVTLVLVATLRPPAEQGFYFVFANVQALAVLFEFGVGSMVVQFASHAGRGAGVSSGRTRFNPSESPALMETLVAAWRWFGTAALCVVAIIFPLGFWLFRAEGPGSGVSYVTAWVVLVASLGSYLTIVPFVCLLEGSGELRSVYRMRVAQAFSSVVCLWALIPMVGSLHAVAGASVATLAVAIGWLVRRYPGLLSSGLHAATRRRASRRDSTVAAAQRRTTASWIVAFAGPQLVSPIVFHYQGAAAAGRMGLSMAAATAPLMLAVAWLQAKYPEFGRLAAQDRLGDLDAYATRVTAAAVAMFCALSVAMLGTVAGLRGLFPGAIAERFLPIGAIAWLSAAGLASLLYQAMAARLRAHREESLLWPVVFGTLFSVATTLAGARYGPSAAAVAYAGAMVGVLLPWSTVVFFRRRRVLRAS